MTGVKIRETMISGSDIRVTSLVRVDSASFVLDIVSLLTKKNMTFTNDSLAVQMRFIWVTALAYHTVVLSAQTSSPKVITSIVMKAASLWTRTAYGLP